MKGYLLGILLCNTLALAVEGENLLKNPGFEEIKNDGAPANWRVQQTVAPWPATQYDTLIKGSCVGDAKRTGARGLRLTNFKKQKKQTKFATFTLMSDPIAFDPT
jgi:hypothetical protein